MIGTEVVFRHDNGEEFRLPLVDHPEAESTFISAQPVVFHEGAYDATLHVTLSSGLPVSIPLPNHIIAQFQDEYVSIELNDTSLSSEVIDIGTIGDAKGEGSVEMIVRLHNIDRQIDVEINEIGLCLLYTSPSPRD